MKSNCVIEALREFHRRRRAWRAAGEPIASTPYLLIRPSRIDGGILHVLVGHLDAAEDCVRVTSFKPVEPVRRGCLNPPILFEGRWVEGDTEPAPFDEERPTTNE